MPRLTAMINVFGSDIGPSEIEAVISCMKSQWVGFGKTVNEFEDLFASRLGLEHFLMVDSGSNALYMACYLLNVKEGDEVIVPSFTWVSCAQAVMMCGAIPIFADVGQDSMNITAESIARVISPRTKAIMVVHYAGLPCDMEEILNFGIPVIEDAAHASDAYYQGKACGSMGDIGIYSFDAVKNLTAIEAGGITIRNPELQERAAHMRYCGIGKSGFDSAASSINNRWWEYNITEPFIKMLPTNLHAAVGIEQLKRLTHLQQKRRDVWDTYTDALRDVHPIKLPVSAKMGDQHGLFTFCIRCADRDALASHLLSLGIYTTVRYHPLHMNKIYQQTDKSLPGAELLNKTALSLPLHPRLTESDVQQVCEAVISFYNK